MNEVYGLAAKQIFDLAHHRRPIAFTSPNGGTTRKETVVSLAKELESALRGVVKLGLVGGYGGDDEIQHQRHLSEIQAIYQSSGRSHADYPRIEVVFRPSLFKPNRWVDAESLEGLLRNIGPRTERLHRYPPQQTGTAPMDWGIYNDTYGDPWALTYAGQFWGEFRVGGWQEITLWERDASVSPETPENLVIPAGRWVTTEHALKGLSTAFQLARNLSRHVGDSERVQFQFSARNIRECWLHFQSGDSMGPCRAPNIQRKVEETATGFRENWLEHFAKIGKDFCDLFCRDGRVMSLDDVKSYRNVAGDL